MFSFFAKHWGWWLVSVLVAALLGWLLRMFTGRAGQAQPAAAESGLLQQHKAKINALTTDVEAHRKTIAGLNAELDTHKAKVAELDAEKSAASSELGTIKGVLAEHEAAAQTAAGDEGAHAAALASLNAELDAHKATAAQHAEALATATGTLESQTSRIAELEADLAACRQSNASHLVAGPSVPTAEQLAEGSRILGSKVALDDLKVIEGIGPAIAQLMIDGGVTTWRGLEAAPVTRLREILEGGGSRFQMHDPTTWPQQAGLLADGKWAEFKQLTDNLDGGRVS
jgi:predicted flap endonuclease-1-like 5' DNA nuclease